MQVDIISILCAFGFCFGVFGLGWVEWWVVPVLIDWVLMVW